MESFKGTQDSMFPAFSWIISLNTAKNGEVISKAWAEAEGVQKSNYAQAYKALRNVAARREQAYQAKWEMEKSNAEFVAGNAQVATYAADLAHGDL